jgi:hypothetical protein
MTAGKLRPELNVFESYRLRGGIRVGNLMLASNPANWLASLSAVLARMMEKLQCRTLADVVKLGLAARVP